MIPAWGGIRRIALGDQAIGHQVAPAHCQADLVPVVGRATVLDEDVGKRLEEGIHDGAVDADFPPLLDLFVFPVSHEQTVDSLQGLSAQGLDGTVKGRLGEPLMGNADPAEVSIAAGVHQVEGQFLVSEAAQCLDDLRAQDLLGRHAAGPGGVLRTASEVLPDHVGDGRNGVEYVADPAELLSVGMVDVGDQQRHLNSSFFAHFEGALSFLSCVITIGWRHFYNT